MYAWRRKLTWLSVTILLLMNVLKFIVPEMFNYSAVNGACQERTHQGH